MFKAGFAWGVSATSQDSSTKHDESFNLARAVYLHSQTRPNALAIACNEHSMTYRELACQASSLALRLQTSPGWMNSESSQPRVGILASRSPEAYIAALSTMWAGATYVPLGTKLPEERLASLISQCKLSAIIADKEGAQLLSEKLLKAVPQIYVLNAEPLNSSTKNVQCFNLNTFKNSDPINPANVNQSDTAYIIFTSGTTGIPKCVMISTGAARHYIDTMTAFLGLRESDRLLETFEFTFDVSVQNMLCAWEAGASLHVLPAVRVMNAIKFAREHELTVWISVPSLVGMLRQVKALSEAALPKLRITIFGGEPLSKSIVDVWRAVAPFSTVYNHYGPSEATVCCLSQTVTEFSPLTPGRDVVSIGMPLPGNVAAIFDEAGNPVQEGGEGELAITGKQLALGYLNAPELTAAKFRTYRGQRWYFTGDRAMQDRDGNFHHLGRVDNQIKVLGHRVELEEIDAHLRVATGVDVVGTVAWPMVNGSAQGLVCFVGAKTIDEAQIVQTLKEKLPRYMIPNRILALEDMPFNNNGKIDRSALKQMLDSRRA